MGDVRVVRLDRQGLAQQDFALRVLTAHPVQIGQVQHRRNEIRIETQRRVVFGLRCLRLGAPRIQQAQIEMRLRPIGVDQFGGGQFILGGGEGGVLFYRNGSRVHAGQSPRRLGADRADRIVQQRQGGRYDRNRYGRPQCTRSGGSNQRIGIHHRGGDGGA